MRNIEDVKKNFLVRIPDSTKMFSQADEYFTVIHKDTEQVLKLHDYVEIYKIPGLYKHLLLDVLGDQSPATLSSRLIDQVSKAGESANDLKVLDMGAGIGLSGRSLAQNGVQSMVGLDILPEARDASHRELPGTYLEYYVADLLKLSEKTKTELINHQFNCLVCCSALTYHLPIQAFIEAFNLIADSGWVAFNVGQSKLDAKYSLNDDFYQFFKAATDNKIFEVNQIYHYQHRLSMLGNPIYYCAVIGRKKRNFFLGN
ncbi:MAG: class I SAM-dependent methyltransferase [Cyanobacteria bacterium P01_F01_bin.13]